MRIIASSLLLLPFVVGCGGPTIAPVSGTVTLNGKPYKGAIVSFQPQGSRDAQEPGRGSAGLTDDKGKYSLIYDGQRPGALIGKHRVRIFTQLGATPGQDDGVEPGRTTSERLVELIPPEWNEQSDKEFTVPSSGTTQADFAIETKKPKK